jgi:caspase domain-containing protein
MVFEHGYALIIGVDDSVRPGLKLPVVANDVAALGSVFADEQHCAYAAENVKVIAGAQATRNGILDGLAWLRGKLKADTSEQQTAVVYYSGHGHRDAKTGEAFLVPYDVAMPLHMGSLKAKDFADLIQDMTPRRLLVVLDCCHAAALDVKDAPEAAVDIAPNAVAPEVHDLGVLATGEGRAVLSSSTGEQKSYIRADGRMSVFTYHLVDALLGRAATPDASAVTVTQLMGHVAACVPRTTQAERKQPQDPRFRFEGSDFPIAMVCGGNGIAKGEPSPDPLAITIRADLRIDVLRGTAVNVDIHGRLEAPVQAQASLGTIEKEGTFTNVKVKSIGLPREEDT